MNNFCFARIVFSAVRKIDVHNGIGWEFVNAVAQEAAQTDVLSSRHHFKLLSLTVGTSQLQGDPQPHAHFRSRDKLASLSHLLEACPQRVEVDRLFKITHSA